MPGNVALGLTFGATLVLALLAQLDLQLTFRLVEHPVSLAAANLEADATVVRGWYAVLLEQGTYLQMIRTELVDLLWPIALGAALIALFRFVGGLLRRVHPPISRVLFRWAPLAAIGPAFDVIENAFSLAMLTDPFGFPAWWSVAHVIASWLKIACSVVAAVVGSTLTIIALVSVRRSRKATDARQALPSR
jgi:hypothetical protein